MTQRQPYSVLVVIYNQSHEFLLLQRSDDPLFWQSVTGGIDQGETPLQTAYRELKEETGIDAKALGLEIVAHDHVNHYEIRPEWRHRYSANDYINTEYVFSIQVPNATLVTLNPNEHLNYCWLDAQQALDKVWSASNRDEIAALAQLFQPS
ncbi:dihydroneopterin triphosphate diphosphatase [Pseudoalteromonas fenneropenaei]|uniref:Dihydroneopterin triphosphate diphosphatase n=1 Tax=Pseudoalteromonas fenneropenaei TaxID=1737459 RepID=A0ABV7CQ33_9GAMM